jgi:hypothetical protein
MSFMPKKQALACAVSMLVVMAGAQARELSPSLLAAAAHMTPTQRAAFLRGASSAERAAGTFTTSGSGLDTTPPVLKSFHVAVPADTAKPWAQIRIDCAASDDLSGVQYIDLLLTGPHGQELYVWDEWLLHPPAKQYSTSMATDVSAYTEPGVWTVSSVDVMDAAGNYVAYTDPQVIAQFGATSFTLVNNRPEMVDYTSPVLGQGAVVTPSLSASGTQKGTSAAPIAEVDLTVKDTGRAGAHWASGTWCLADMSACLNLDWTDSVRGESKKKAQLTGRIDSSLPAGDYLPYYFAVTDWAYNQMSFRGSDFGGATDFGQLMPGGDKITITP